MLDFVTFGIREHSEEVSVVRLEIFGIRVESENVVVVCCDTFGISEPSDEVAVEPLEIFRITEVIECRCGPFGYLWNNSAFR